MSQWGTSISLIILCYTLYLIAMFKGVDTQTQSGLYSKQNALKRAHIIIIHKCIIFCTVRNQREKTKHVYMFKTNNNQPRQPVDIQTPHKQEHISSP